jgi:voltage-gated potassium channel
MDQKAATTRQRALKRQRWKLLREASEFLERPMIVLAFVWLALLIYEFTRGLTPALQLLTYVIWALFGVDFLIRFFIAPAKLAYLQRNLITILSLILPALRILRVFQAARLLRATQATRSLRMIRLMTSLNRSIRAARNTLVKRGVGYVLAVTFLVVLGGAAGMLAFENPAAVAEVEGEVTGRGLTSYGEAVWWTAMVMTTMGSEYWPQTPEGRLLCLFLAVYAFTVFGYITATIASHFIGTDRADREQEDFALHAEIRQLRLQIDTLITQKSEGDGGSR